MKEKVHITQNQVFKDMTADEKLKTASGLWRLGKSLNKKQNGKRSSKHPGRSGRDSRKKFKGRDVLKYL